MSAGDPFSHLAFVFFLSRVTALASRFAELSLSGIGAGAVRVPGFHCVGRLHGDSQKYGDLYGPHELPEADAGRRFYLGPYRSLRVLGTSFRCSLSLRFLPATRHKIYLAEGMMITLNLGGKWWLSCSGS